jgi:hypothetical protein
MKCCPIPMIEIGVRKIGAEFESYLILSSLFAQFQFRHRRGPTHYLLFLPS